MKKTYDTGHQWKFGSNGTFLLSLNKDFMVAWGIYEF